MQRHTLIDIPITMDLSGGLRGENEKYLYL